MDIKLKQKLQEEFHWLCEKYSLRELTIDLALRDATIFNEGKNEAFICDSIEKGNLQTTLCISYSKDSSLSKTDLLVLRKYLKVHSHLPFWYLYHEYGHLLEVDKIVHKHGIAEANSYITAQLKSVDSLITSIKSEIKYKELAMEKSADLFAINTYMNRVKELMFF